MWPKPRDSPAITTKDTNEIKQALNEVREKVVAPIVPVSVNLSCERLMHIEGPIHRKFDIQWIVLTQRPRALRIDMGFFKPIPADASKVAAYFPFATSPWIYKCDLSNYETRTAFNVEVGVVVQYQRALWSTAADGNPFSSSRSIRKEIRTSRSVPDPLFRNRGSSPQTEALPSGGPEVSVAARE